MIWTAIPIAATPSNTTHKKSKEERKFPEDTHLALPLVRSLEVGGVGPDRLEQLLPAATLAPHLQEGLRGQSGFAAEVE